MVEKKNEETKAKAAPKKAPAAKSETKVAEVKAPAPKAAAPKAEKKAAPKSHENGAGATITLRQVGSPIGRQDYQRATLIGLGLNKLNRTRTLEDTPSVRGMIAKVKHLVEVVKA